VIILGLGNSGKTTLLDTLKQDPHAKDSSILHSNVEELILGNVKLTTSTLPDGNTQIDHVWQDSFSIVDGIIFLVDSTDRSRFDQAKAIINFLLSDERVLNTPFTILGTKNDLQGAISREQLRQVLHVFPIIKEEGAFDPINPKRPLQTFMCSVKDHESYGHAFRWIGTYLKDI